MTLNVKALERVADWLERGAPHEEAPGMHFDMMPMILVPDYSPRDENWCGTACCIAGAVITFEQPNLIPEMLAEGACISKTYDRNNSVNVFVWSKAVDLLGIEEYEAAMLFAPFDADEDELAENMPEVDQSCWPFKSQNITPAWAAATVRHVIATGEVRWDLTKPVEFVA